MRESLHPLIFYLHLFFSMILKVLKNLIFKFIQIALRSSDKTPLVLFNKIIKETKDLYRGKTSPNNKEDMGPLLMTCDSSIESKKRLIRRRSCCCTCCGKMSKLEMKHKDLITDLETSNRFGNAKHISSVFSDENMETKQEKSPVLFSILFLFCFTYFLKRMEALKMRKL